MEDVFLGYKRENMTRAQEVAAGLRAEGLTVFFDVSVPVGEHWDDVIEQRVDAAKAVVILWSEQSRASVPVRGEAHRGLELKKLAPARIDACRIPINFTTVQTADLCTWRLGDFTNSEWRRLTSSISGLVSKADRAARSSRIKSISDILAMQQEAVARSDAIPDDLLEEFKTTTSQWASPSPAELATLRNAALKSETWAQYVLGALHLFGTSVERDPVLALTWFMRAAERGSSGAYYALGLLLELGIGVQRNLRAAAVAYERAGLAGHLLGAQGASRLAFALSDAA